MRALKCHAGRGKRGSRGGLQRHHHKLQVSTSTPRYCTVLVLASRPSCPVQCGGNLHAQPVASPQFLPPSPTTPG